MFKGCLILEEKLKLNSNIILENRKKLTLSGVKDVVGFDEETIALDTVLGKVTIKGSKLHIQNFNTENGDLTADGKINAVVYISEEKNNGFISKLFR